MEIAITDRTRCLLLRCGVEVWITGDEERALQSLLNEEQAFLTIRGNFISRHEVRGIFGTEAMAEMRRRKNGEWQSKDGTWHQKGERVCSCGNALGFGVRCGYCSST